MLQLLLSKDGMDVNKPNNNGWSPLHVAISFSDAETVGFLLENGADSEAMNKVFVLVLLFVLRDLLSSSYFFSSICIIIYRKDGDLFIWFVNSGKKKWPKLYLLMGVTLTQNLR